MFGVKRPHLRFSKHHSSDENKKSTSSNPSDDADETHNICAARRTSSEPAGVTPDMRASLFYEDSVKKTIASYSVTSSARSKYKNDFRDSGGYENQSVQELESYAVYKSEETTKTVNNCLKIAEDIREDAAKTLVQLHHQGEQINRTHMVATEIDHDLSRGEKLLGNLGGMFSRTWKPKKNRDITGPLMTRDDSFVRSNHLQQRDKLRLNEAPKRRSQSRTPPPESADAYQRVEFEKAKQDDGLSDLSDLLGDLKNMAIDMGNELERQKDALDPMEKDIDELNDRVNQANRRTRRLLGK
uniref:t-SNARE coiled-coil homology domain-containing protein n=1 Tax=Kalanchoe fedtschenkoi TaxID=63787 RepID=A0A7N0T1K5_KALFE